MVLQLTIDGTANGTITAATTGTMTLTTTNTNDVIYVVVGINGGTVTVSSVTASGLTFGSAARKRIANGANCALEVWTANATSALSGTVITVNLSASGTTAMQCFGVTGSSVGGTGGYSNFDSNTTNIPATNTGNSASPASTYITNIPVAILLSSMVQLSNTAITVPTNFTQVQAATANSTTLEVMVAYQLVTMPQSSVTATWTITSNQWATIGDSIIFGTTRLSVINGMVSLANNASYDAKPVLGQEWVIHNVEFPAAVSLVIVNGSNTITFASQTGSGVFANLYLHVNNNQWLRITNNASGGTNLYSFDGVQTSP